MAYDVREESRVRWMFAGAFCPTPTGKCWRVDRGNFQETMQKANLEVSVEVADRLGVAGRRNYSLRFDKLSEFKLTAVVDKVAELKALKELAEALGAADPTKRPSLEGAAEAIAAAFGGGGLASALRALAVNPAAASDAAAPALAPAVDQAAQVDKIFEQTAGTEKPRTAAAAVSSFIDAMRAGSARGGAKIATSEAKKARNLVEDALYGTAADILRSDVVSRLEGVWKGLRLVLDQTPTPEEVDLIVADVEAARVPAVFEELLPDDPVDWPDAYFIVEPCKDVMALAAAGMVAEQLNAPVVAWLPTSTLGDALLAEAADEVDNVDKALGPEWTELRRNDVSRWISVVANRVVVATEGTGPAARTCFSSPVFGAAALLSSSYKATSSFAKVFGQDSALCAPATWQLPDGHAGAGSTVPLESFVSIRAQAEIGSLGITALGSGRNSDKFALTRWPTMSGSSDAVPLPAQILTGRIVRFALWVRDQLPPGADADQVKKVYEDAAKVFLFGKFAQGVEFSAQLVESAGQSRQVLIGTRMHGSLAGIPFSFAFPLPLDR